MAMRRMRLRKARHKKGLSQEALAEALETTQVTISQWESGEVLPSPHFVGKLRAFFGVDDPADLDIVFEDEETSEHQSAPAQSSLQEDEVLVSASPEAEIHESMIPDPEAPSEEDSDSDEALPDAPTKAHVPITGRMWLPKASILHHFIASDMTRCYWQIAHTDYSTSDEMTNAVRAATKGFDMMNTGDITYKITRREAMCELASVPMIALGRQQTLHTKRYEEMLRYCTAALEACWELYRGSDPIGTKHALDCVCTYIPILETIAKDSAQYRKEALDLATRYALLQTLLGEGRAHSWETVGYAQNALDLSRESGDILLQLSAYTKLGTACFRDRQYKRAYKTILKGENVLQDYQRMKKMPPIPSGIIGSFNSGYALIQTRNGISPDTALGIATNSEPLKEPIALVEFTASTQWLEGAKTCCSKGDPTQAIKWIAKRIDPVTLVAHPGVPQSEHGRIEAVNTMTHALLQFKEPEMDHVIPAWIVGMEGAQALKNEETYRQATINFERMLSRWPGEQAIMKLVPLTSHW